MKTAQYEAIVLSHRNYKDQDYLISLFTRHEGRKRVIAKGVRSVTSRRRAHVEVFSHVQLVLRDATPFPYIGEAISTNLFPLLRERLERMVYAYTIVELIERLTPENEDSEVIFRQLHMLLSLFNDDSTRRVDAQQAVFDFKQFLLRELGFAQYDKPFDQEVLDTRIEAILESRLKSPQLLTNMYQNL